MRRAHVHVFPPLPPSAYARRAPRHELPFPLEDPRCRLFSLARHGLACALPGLGLEPGDGVLAPAYHHGSEIEALTRTGLSCHFYDATDSLEPDADELEALIAEGGARALHLVHHLGFPQDARRWRAWCEERKLLLIEDAAQAWLATRDGAPVGSAGHLAIFSLYKTVGVPDGGAVVCTPPPPAPGGNRALAAGRVLKAHAAWLTLRWPRLVGLRPQRGRVAVDGVPPGEFELGHLDTPPSPVTRFLAPRLAGAAVAEARRRNYQRLLQRLGRAVPPPFHELPAGASPFALPVEAGDKPALLRSLARHGIGALDVWSVPHPSLPVGAHPAAARRRARTVGLPVHQELSRPVLDLMADVVASEVGDA